MLFSLVSPEYPATQTSSEEIAAIALRNRVVGVSVAFQLVPSYGTVWNAVSAPHLTGMNENALLGVTDLSPTNAWAAGYTTTPSQMQLLEHWDGTEWSDSPGPRLPEGSEPYLSSISADSPTDIWAAGHILQDDGLHLFSG